MVSSISDKLVKRIEEHADTIIQRWVERLQSDAATPSFNDDTITKFEKKALQVIKELSNWVAYETSQEDVGRQYAREGMGLFNMGIPLCEGIRAVTLLKRSIWLYVVYESAFDSAIELHQMRELNERVALFFERAEYYFTRGYMEGMNQSMKTFWDLTDTDTRAVFFDKSFYIKTKTAP